MNVIPAEKLITKKRTDPLQKKKNAKDIQLKYMAYQFDSVEHFSLFTDLLYVHLWRKIA